MYKRNTDRQTLLFNLDGMIFCDLFPSAVCPAAHRHPEMKMTLSDAGLSQQLGAAAAAAGQRPSPVVVRCTASRRPSNPSPIPATHAPRNGTSWTSADRSKATRLSRACTLAVQTIKQNHTAGYKIRKIETHLLSSNNKGFHNECSKPQTGTKENYLLALTNLFYNLVADLIYD